MILTDLQVVLVLLAITGKNVSAVIELVLKALIEAELSSD